MVSKRATFCWPDSVYQPHVVKGPEKLDELCQLADGRDVAPRMVSSAPSGLPLDDPSNDYVEEDVYGGLSIVRDVEAVVLDPTGREIHTASLERLGRPVEEHFGYRVAADSIDLPCFVRVQGSKARYPERDNDAHGLDGTPPMVHLSPLWMPWAVRPDAHSKVKNRCGHRAQSFSVCVVTSEESHDDHYPVGVITPNYTTT